MREWLRINNVEPRNSSVLKVCFPLHGQAKTTTWVSISRLNDDDLINLCLCLTEKIRESINRVHLAINIPRINLLTRKNSYVSVFTFTSCLRTGLTNCGNYRLVNIASFWVRNGCEIGRITSGMNITQVSRTVTRTKIMVGKYLEKSTLILSHHHMRLKVFILCLLKWRNTTF